MTPDRSGPADIASPTVMPSSATLGQGGGLPPHVLLCDLMQPSPGTVSLHRARMASLAILGWCVIHFLLAARTMPTMPREAVN